MQETTPKIKKRKRADNLITSNVNYLSMSKLVMINNAIKLAAEASHSYLQDICHQIVSNFQ